jgi:hypothetical protein
MVKHSAGSLRLHQMVFSEGDQLPGAPFSPRQWRDAPTRALIPANSCWCWILLIALLTFTF